MTLEIGMIVQLRLSEFWGSEEEDQICDSLRESLDQGCKGLSLGQFDGTDTGSGTTNFFIFRIRAEDWDKAVEFVIGEVRGRELLDQVRVVRSETDLDDADPIPKH